MIAENRRNFLFEKNQCVTTSRNLNSANRTCTEEMCKDGFHPWQMQTCFFAGSCQPCDKLNGLINEMEIHEMAQLAKIHIENSFSVVGIWHHLGSPTRKSSIYVSTCSWRELRAKNGRLIESLEHHIVDNEKFSQQKDISLNQFFSNLFS